MYADNPKFRKPESEDTTIWRYMDLAKFVSLLDKKALFFERLDRLQRMDKFEGALTREIVERMNSADLLKLIRSRQSEKQKEAGENRFKDFRKLYRKTTVINCWHMNEDESDAMWGLYATRNAGIAIKSTFKRLRDSFSVDKKNTVSIGLVEYIDFEKTSMPNIARFYPFMYKRSSFSHEKELRAVVMDLDRWFVHKQGRIAFEGKEPFENSLYISVDLDALISTIYVSPDSQEYFFEAVKSITKKFGLSKEVKKSHLSYDPLY